MPPSTNLPSSKNDNNINFRLISTPQKHPLIPWTAGCIAGAIEAITTWPMEFIKTQLQLQQQQQPSKFVTSLSDSAKMVRSSFPYPYNDMISGLTYTVRSTGFLSLYRGLAPTLLGSVPKSGVRFGMNAYLKDLLREDNNNTQLTAGQNLLAGVGAGVTEAVIIVVPIETIKTRCIERDLSFRQGLQSLVWEDRRGIRGIYKGLTATVLKQGSNQGLRFMWFNEYKRLVTSDGQKIMTPLMGLVGGMTAGLFSTVGNNPFDVVKTRMQGIHASQYINTFDCFQQILTNEGISAFYKGFLPRLGRVIPGQGVIFMSFEIIQDTLEELCVHHKS